MHITSNAAREIEAEDRKNLNTRNVKTDTVDSPDHPLVLVFMTDVSLTCLPGAPAHKSDVQPILCLNLTTESRLLPIAVLWRLGGQSVSSNPAFYANSYISQAILSVSRPRISTLPTGPRLICKSWRGVPPSIRTNI